MLRITLAIAAFYLCCGCAALQPESITLADKGKTVYVITHSVGASKSEQFAARELAVYLGKLTGAEFSIVIGSNAARSIQVGDTVLAQKASIDVSKLGREEWVIKTVGDTLFIAGGKPRGTLYGVYAFLETQAGISWLTPAAEFVPSKPTFVIPQLDIQAEPAFAVRYIASGFGLQKPTLAMRQRYQRFVTRNRQNGAYGSVETGFDDRYGSPGSCHTFGNYIPTKKYFTTHPEYFSMAADGKREGRGIAQNLGWQLCLSNPELRKLILKKLKAYIAADRAKAAKIGAEPPTIYTIDQNDSTKYICLCPECKKITDREGAQSGLVIDFINELADAIRTDYPDVLLMTFAYACTEQTPKNIKPRDNVVIRYCDYYISTDLLRPLAHPVNSYSYNILTNWGKISKNLAVWDYPKLYEQTSPYFHLENTKADLELFLKNNTKILFMETEGYLAPVSHFKDIQSLYPLKAWAIYKLMQNPTLPVKQLVTTFCKAYYGPAAQSMMEYCDFLENASTKTDPDKLIILTPDHKKYSAFTSRKYLNLDFYVKANQLIDQAEKACAGNQKFLLRVSRERLPLDDSLLRFWRTFKAQLPKGKAMPFDQSAIIARAKSNWQAWSAATFSPEFHKMIMEQVAMEPLLGGGLPLSAKFKDVQSSDIFDITWHKLHAGRAHIKPDADAAGGKALVLTGDPKQHEKPLKFGIYNSETKKFLVSRTIAPKDLAQDEKFHLYKIGRSTVTPGTYIWAHWTWYIQQKVDGAFHPDYYDQEWDCYISIKATGPAYVKGSTARNAITVDRVILVKADDKKK
jgi:uncharacterized protein DUF4838